MKITRVGVGKWVALHPRTLFWPPGFWISLFGSSVFNDLLDVFILPKSLTP